MPFTMEINDLPLYMRYGNPPQAYSDALKRIVDKYDTIGRPPAVLDITAHAHVFGRPYGAIEFKAAIEAVMNVDWVWMTTHEELAGTGTCGLRGAAAARPVLARWPLRALLDRWRGAGPRSERLDDRGIRGRAAFEVIGRGAGIARDVTACGEDGPRADECGFVVRSRSEKADGQASRRRSGM